MRAHGAATETRFLQAYAQGRQERRCRATQTARTITSQLGHVWGRSNAGRDEMATGCTHVATKGCSPGELPSGEITTKHLRLHHGAPSEFRGESDYKISAVALNQGDLRTTGPRSYLVYRDTPVTVKALVRVPQEDVTRARHAHFGKVKDSGRAH